MNQIPEKNRDQRDERLDQAIAAIVSQPVPPFDCDRAIARLVQSTEITKPSQRRPLWRRFPALTAAACVAIMLTGLWLVSRIGGGGTPLSGAGEETKRPMHAALNQENDTPQGTHESSTPREFVAAKLVPNIKFLVAQSAPIIVANGPAHPIDLGASLSPAELDGTLHVWDWTKSGTSRVVTGEKLWANEQVAISRTGRFLTWAKGIVVNLETGDRSTTKLGGADYKIGNDFYGRILDMQFSPDEQRMALVVDLEPGPLFNVVIQIVDFPSGEVVRQFGAAAADTLWFAFSSDSKQIVISESEDHLIRYDIAMGELLTRYRHSSLRSIRTIAMATQGKYLAAADNQNLYVWNVSSGEIVHIIQIEHPDDPVLGLRFSDNDELLAVFGVQRELSIISLDSGKPVSKLAQRSVGSVHWEDHGKAIAVVTRNSITGGNGTDPVGFRELYPAVHFWDWQAGTRIRSLNAERLDP